MSYDRIVSLAPSNTEILYVLGVQEQVVATTAVCDYPKEVREKPSVGGWTNPDIEEVQRFEPDLVLASDELQNEAVDHCESVGLPVKQFTPTTFQDVFNTIKMIGELVDRENEAWNLVDSMNKDVQELAVSTPETRPRVYCEEWHEPPMVGGNWIPRLVRMIGGAYLLEEGERSREVSTTEVQEFDPEHIVLHYCGFGDAADPQKVAKRDGWQDVTAVKEGKVHVINDSLLNRPGPRLVEGMRDIKEILAEQ